MANTDHIMVSPSLEMRQFNNPFFDRYPRIGKLRAWLRRFAVDHKGWTLWIWLHAILFRQSRYSTHFIFPSTRNDEVLRVWKSISTELVEVTRPCPYCYRGRESAHSCARVSSPRRSTYARLQIDFVSRLLLFGPTSSPLPSKCSTAGQESTFFCFVACTTHKIRPRPLLATVPTFAPSSIWDATLISRALGQTPALTCHWQIHGNNFSSRTKISNCGTQFLGTALHGTRTWIHFTLQSNANFVLLFLQALPRVYTRVLSHDLMTVSLSNTNSQSLPGNQMLHNQHKCPTR